MPSLQGKRETLQIVSAEAADALVQGSIPRSCSLGLLLFMSSVMRLHAGSLLPLSAQRGSTEVLKPLCSRAQKRSKDCLLFGAKGWQKERIAR